MDHKKYLNLGLDLDEIKSYLWALISMFGLVGAGAVVGGKKLGQPYPTYKRQVRGRIIPGLPI